MKVDPSLFVNHEEADAFVCQICHCVSNDPTLEHIQCSRKYCRSCFDSPTGKALTECLHCHCPVRGQMKVMSPLTRDKVLLQLSMQCPHEDCRQVYPFSQHAAHLASCGAMPVNCSYCSASMTAKALTTHQQTVCPLYPVPCPVPGCTALPMPRCQMEEHENANLRQHNALLMAQLKANEANKADVTLLRGEELLQVLLQLGSGNRLWPYFFGRRSVSDKINQLDEFTPAQSASPATSGDNEEPSVSDIVQRMCDEILAVLTRQDSGSGDSNEGNSRATKRARHQTAYDDEYETRYVFKANNQTLRVAVKLWCTPQTHSLALSVYGHISTWNTSCVTNMASLFQQEHTFNDDINAWDVSNVEDMSWMFHEAIAFNQPLNNWRTDNVTTMFNMFYRATAFNQPIENWNTSKVTSMYQMFHSASSFNQPLNRWDVSKVEAINHMFFKCEEFNQPLDSWNLQSTTDLDAMFCNASKFNQPLNAWNVGHIRSIDSMFAYASSFNQPLDQWDVSNVTQMGTVFQGSTSFNQSLESWNLTNVQSAYCMFNDANSFSFMNSLQAKWPRLF